MRMRLTSALMVALVGGFLAPAAAQEPPSPARIAELSEQWVDPLADAPPGTTYHLFETASRGKGTKGSYLIYLPPSYETETARRYPVIYWLHGGFGNARQGAWTVGHWGRGLRLLASGVQCLHARHARRLDEPGTLPAATDRSEHRALRAARRDGTESGSRTPVSARLQGPSRPPRCYGPSSSGRA